MKLVSRFSLALVLAALVAWPAFAGEKIFRLKNGRRIEGELVEETPTSYVVRTSGGRTVLPKEAVLKVEDPPPPPKPFLEPDPPKAPEAPPPDESDQPAAPATAPSATPPAASPPAATPAPAPASSFGTLASESEIAAARKALLAVPQVTVADPANSTAERRKAIDEISRLTPISALVAIVAEPETATRPTSPEQLLAREILSAMDGARVRPAIARAIGTIDLSQGKPIQLMALIGVAGDGEDGAVTTALVAKVQDLIARGQNPAMILAPLEWFGGRPALRALFQLLLVPDKANSAEALARTCKGIVSHSDDPESAIAVVVGMIDPDKLPPLDRLGPALDVFGGSKREGVYPVARVLDRVEHMDVPDDQKAALNTCLDDGYRALASIWSREARDRLLRSIDEARTPERRIQVLHAFGVYRAGQVTTPPDFLGALAERMAYNDRTEEEVRAFGGALEILANRKLGVDPTAWQGYVNTLQR